jgi:hypothetical protein
LAGVKQRFQQQNRRIETMIEELAYKADATTHAGVTQRGGSRLWNGFPFALPSLRRLRDPSMQGKICDD